MKYTKPTCNNEAIEVADVINASIVKVANVQKEILVKDENGVLVPQTVTATQVSVDISNLF